ncbi:MAG: hypothetical protein D6695_02875 [Planctomycetota bacterium]|nr:MAG: hypothetical protein D6695_02875 [Planctomycetota bacterium]
MSNLVIRRLNAISSLCWGGVLGLLALGLFAIHESDLTYLGDGGGFVLACTFFGLALLSGRGVGTGSVIAGASLGTIGLWLEPLGDVLGPEITSLGASLGLAESLCVTYLTPLMTVLTASVVLGMLLCGATGSGAVSAQCVLAGIVACGCLLIPGDPMQLTSAAALLWALIVLLSLGSWAKHHAQRVSESSAFVRLAQEGPLATLSRGSTQHAS